MDRRTFVKACVTAGTAGALGAGAVAAFASSVKPRAEGGDGTVRYFGAHLVGGPAPRGVPFLPLEARGGVLRARPTLEVDGQAWDALRWLRYCGHAGLDALRPEWSGDEALRYHLPDEAARVVRPWYADSLGQAVRPEDFPGEGFGARVLWRGSVPGVLVKLPGGDVAFPAEPRAPAQPIVLRRERDAVRSMLAEGFALVNNWCTHFCCEAGYKEAEALARPRNAWEHVFCTCHGVQFDAREAVAYRYVPEG